MNELELENKILKEENNFRSIKNILKKEEKYIFVDDKKLLNLSSNDYLGIGNNKEYLKLFFEKYYNDFLFSSNSSRLLTGNEEIYFELENFIAKTFKKDKALLFNSGYVANLGILSSLLNKNDLVILDKLDHASIIDGVKLSEAKFLRYNHLNYNQLENFLIKERKNYKKVLIVSESLFSMDGDFVDLKKIIELKNKYDCLLMIDESHSFGVYGENGFGYCYEKQVVENVDIIISGFGKATGSVGAFCVANKTIIDYLINKARSLIFSTSLPPINIAWTKFILEKIFNQLNDKRKDLINLSKYFNKKINSLGYKNNSESFIIPIILNSEEKLKHLAEEFLKANYYILPIKYPTVAKNSPRFRISLTSNIVKSDLDNLIDILKKY